MELARALEIVKQLADGTDPLGGKAFPKDSPYQHPEVVRALHAVLESVPRRVRRAAGEPGLSGALNAGKTWTPADEAELTQAFAAGTVLEELAAKYGRTKAGIVTRLIKLGKVKPEEYPEYSKLLEKSS